MSHVHLPRIFQGILHGIEHQSTMLHRAAVKADDEQAAFEKWLTDTCPSGDVTEVQRQWEASREYLDLFDGEAA